MRKRQRQVNRYVRAVGSYLPCAGKHKKQLLTALRSEAEAYCAETRAFSTFSILPHRGRMAWKRESRP